MCVWACSTWTESTVVSPPRPIGPTPVSFRRSQSSRSSWATSASGLCVPTGRAMASFARCIARSAEPPIPTPTIPGGHGFPPAPTIESSTNRLIALTPSAGTSIFRKLMFSEPDPFGTHLMSSPSQAGTNSQCTCGMRWPVLSPVGFRVSVWTVFERRGWSSVARRVPSRSASSMRAGWSGNRSPTRA